MRTRVERLSLSCRECGQSFALYPSQAKNGRGVYCSKACLGASKRNGSRLACFLCGAEFYRRFGEQDLEVRANQFCSRGCYMGWRAANLKPSTYPNAAGRHLHRAVAESSLGRALLPGEVVHHLDEDKHNNKPSNLSVFPSQSHHKRCHQGDMPDSELRRYLLVQS